MSEKLIVAVDFDGTCVTHEYPNIGEEAPGVVEALTFLQDQGCRIILYTMRHGSHLFEAVRWMQDRGIVLWGVNENPEQKSWTGSPKVYANVYIDDAAIGVPLMYRRGDKRPVVNWSATLVRITERYPELLSDILIVRNDDRIDQGELDAMARGGDELAQRMVREG